MGILKQQVVVIGGGETFDTHEEYLHFLKYKMIFDPAKKRKLGWKENLQKDLGRKFEVINVAMPNKLNAKYEEWSIYFDSVVPHLRPGVILVGHSLGGLFLMKYLEEQTNQIDTSAVMLVSTPLAVSNGLIKTTDGFADFYLRPDWELGGDFFFHVFHSEDDRIVPEIESAMLFSGDDIKKYPLSGRGHFIHDAHFPELVSVIRYINRSRPRTR